MHAQAKIILLVVAPNHLVLEVFPFTTYVMWKRTGEVQVGRVTAEDRGRALHPRKSPKSHGCRKAVQSWAINAGSHLQRPLRRWRTSSQVLQVISCLRRREREIFWQPAYFSWVVHIFFALHQLPWIRQPPPVHAWLALAFVAAVAFSPGAISTSISTDGQLCASICQLLVVSIFSTQSMAVLSSSNTAVSFLSSPDAQGRCYISGVFGGGGGLHGLAAMGHRSTAVLAVSITARGAGLLKTSPFPACLVCSSDRSEVIDWVFSLFSSFSSPPKAGDDLNIVFKGLRWHDLKTALKALISWQVWENLLVASVDEKYWCGDLLRWFPSPQQLLLHVDHREGSVALH